MKYEYKGVTGKTGIEVDDVWGGALIELDRLEYNNDQAETRRHVSFDTLNLDGTLFPSGADIPAEYEIKERDAALQAAIEELPSAQRDLIRAVFFDGIAPSEIARREGVHRPAISNRLGQIYKRLQKLTE